MSEEKKEIKQQELQIHKTIVPMVCPHCSKEIMVACRSYLPVIDWVLRQEDLDAAKVKVKEEVEKTDLISAEEKKDVLTWLDSKDFSFGPAEIDMILERILKK